MNLRAKLVIAITLALGVSTVGTAIIMEQRATAAIVQQAEADGDSLARFLGRAAEFTAELPQKVDRIVGDQMVVEARIAAELVAVAEGPAGLSPTEINRRLRRITQNSVLDEFWITDESGLAYLTNHSDVRFRFVPDPKKQPQAHVFYRLLKQKNGVVVQEARPRDLDPHPFKYVGVSGVDRPRIVQVGYHAQFLSQIADEFSLQRLVDALTGAGNVLAIWVADDHGKVLAASKRPNGGIRVPVKVGQGLDPESQGVLRQVVASHQVRTDVGSEDVDVTGPLLRRDGVAAGAVFIRLSRLPLNAARHTAISHAVIGILGSLLTGFLLAAFLTHRLTHPLREMARGVAALGAGKLDHHIQIEGRDELGQLGAAFNHMAEELDTFTRQLERTVAEKERYSRELEIAGRIQASFLPQSAPHAEGFDLAGAAHPARVVGGDFYDFLPLSPRRLGLAIADVSNKGVPAALFMALSRNVLRAYAAEGTSVAGTLRRLNDFVMSEDHAGMYVTVFCGVLDTRTRTLTYANAGHNPPLFLRRGEVRRLKATGYPVGVIPDATWEEERVTLEEGDVLLLYTDGITEAMDADEEVFEERRLIAVAQENQGRSAEEIAEAVCDAAQTYSGDQALVDDMTVVVLKVLGGEPGP